MRMLLTALCFSILLLPAASIRAESTTKTDPSSESTAADVVVYGSTPGGFCAAIAAAREGASVILLEPTDHVGGLNTGGLSFSDSNQTARSTVMGLFDEWHTRIGQDYADRGIELPYQVSVKDQARWTYEPHVAARVTQEMLDEAGVIVLTEQWLQSVEKEGTQIVGLTTKKGHFTGRMFIDASYEGDLLAASGVSWTIGREGRAEYGESLAGKQYPKSRMNISGFDDNGQPLPFITTTDAGPAEEGDENVMVYSFRLCLTAEPENRVPFPKPDNYDPAKFELLRRYVKSGGKIWFDLYPLPGNKFDGNNAIGGQFSLGLVGACNGWSEADEAGRKEIWEAHKQYTLEYYHFLTTDPAVPEETRNRFARLGLCKDEFPEYDHFSPALYVREGRRMKGMYVVSQKDILEQPEKNDPIVVSSFPIDSHDCQRVALPEGGVINEGTIFPVRRTYPKQGYAYHVPYRSILPQPEECTNLLVPVAMSCTHVGISSIRVEPTWMILGQSAGIAAAVAIEEESTVQDLPYPTLRKRLLARNQVLDLPEIPEPPKPVVSIDPAKLPGIVLDDKQAELTGSWSSSTNFKPHIGVGYIYCGSAEKTDVGDGKKQATFRFTPEKAGQYELRMAYSAHATRASRVPFVVRQGDTETTFRVDQTQTLPAGKQFRPVAQLELREGVEITVTVSNQNTLGFVIIDALQLVEVAE